MKTAIFREYVIVVLRATRLLGPYNSIKFFYVSAKARSDNAEFLREHPNFKVPPLKLCYDAYGHVSYRAYYESGLKHAQVMSGLINAAGVSDGAVLEWGCGPARILRHLPALLKGNATLAGADYNLETIEWCRENSDGIRFEKNELAPPLPFAAESFDAIYALSVITHLSEKMHEEWREELLRVLKPGGVLIITSHGDWYRERFLLPGERAAYDAGQFVMRGGIEEGKKWFAAFHSPAYMRNVFFRGMEILRHVVRPTFDSLEQDVWVAQKRHPNHAILDSDGFHE